MGDRRSESNHAQTWPAPPDSPDVEGSSPQPSEWRAHPGPGSAIGAALALVFGFLAIVLMVFTLTQTGPAFFLSGLVTLMLILATGASVFLAIAAVKLSYELTDDSLLLNVAGLGWRISYDRIQHIVYQPEEPISHQGWERFWPGLRLGYLRTAEGVWRSAATTDPRHRVRVYCDDGSITTISPWRPVQFVTALEARLAASRTEKPLEESRDQPPHPATTVTMEPHHTDVAEELERRIPAFYLGRTILLGERLTSNAIALSLTLIICMALYTVYRVDGVNQPLPARWDAVGEAKFWLRQDGPWVFQGIWFYAAAGLCVLVTNMALSTFLLVVDRQLARLVVLITPAIELALLIALLRGTT